MESEALKGWAGKVILVYVKESGPATQAGIALQDPRIETLFGERFLVGVVPPHEKDWSSNLSAGVRWDQIVHFLAFSSLAEYQKSVREAPAHWEMAKAEGGV